MECMSGDQTRPGRACVAKGKTGSFGMRALLVYTNRSRELVPAPPIGVSYVATATRKAGHQVRLLDLAFSQDPEKSLAEAIAEFSPELIGLSIRNIDNVVLQRLDSPRQELLRLIAICRRSASEPNGRLVPIVLGGPAVSILAERTLDYFGVDYAIAGEGEEAFPMLLRALEAGHSPDDVSGLCWRKDGVLKRNPTRQLSEFSASGMEHWVDWTAYEKGGGTWSMQTKRGCPMRCTYCSYPLIEGRRIRPRSPVEVVDEIEQVLRETGKNGKPRPRTFEFVDSTFNIPSSNAIGICEEIIRRKVKANFTAMGLNPRDVPPELLPLMKRAGFNSVMITPEAACQTMLDNYDKGFTMADIENTLHQVKASGLKSMWFFMLGAPGETLETCAETVAFARDRLTGLKFLSVFFTGIRVLPDTRLAEQAIASAYLKPDVDLAETVFYVSPEVSEKQMIGLINDAIVKNPCIVHAAEGGVSKQQHVLHTVLNALGVAPPFWRFVPEMLSFPLTHYLRSRHPMLSAED